jgi:predicted permease
MLWFANFREDCRFAARIFLKSPGFHFVAIGSMALGIGAASAIFSLAWTVLINPFPYRDPSSIRATTWFDGHTEWGGLPFNTEDADRLRREARTVSGVFFSGWTYLVATGWQPEQVRASLLSSNAFSVLGARPALGRFFSPSDIPVPSSPPRIAVLGYALWQRRFQGDLGAIGKTIELDRQRYNIIGVAPERFTWENSDIYLPMDVRPGSQRHVTVTVRAQPGVPDSAINAELERFTAEFAGRLPDWYPPKYQFRVSSLSHSVLKTFPATVGVLCATAGILLLIACGNVSILLLARASSRTKEVAIRIAMGAPRFRLFRQMLTESVLLALLGAAGGVMLAGAGVPALVAVMPPGAIPAGLEIHLNGWVLAFALAAAIVTGLLFGCAPAWQMARTAVRDGMQEMPRGSTGGTRTVRLRNLLVIAQVGLCAALLAVAAVAVRGFSALSHVELGFDSSNILVAATDLRPGIAIPWEERRTHFGQLRDAVLHQPGVQSVTATLTAIPPRILWPEAFEIPGAAAAPNQQMMLAMVDADYFSTLRIPVLRGRAFSTADIEQPRNVAILNEAAARVFWPGEDPVGQQIRMPNLANPTGSFVGSPNSDKAREIIGVVGSARNHGLLEPAAPAAYIPFPTVLGRSQTLLIRTRGNPWSVVNAARDAVRAVDSDQPLSHITTLEENLDKVERGTSRFTATLFSVFGAVALLLAASGIYSVISYAVALRTNEFGVRMALGASPASVARLVVSFAMRLLAAGLVLGVAVNVLISGWIVRYLYGFKPGDPVATAAVIGILVVVAFMAILAPLSKAVSAQPLDALRHE